MTEQHSRREFLWQAAALALSPLVASAATAAGGAALPQVPFGKHSITRLVCGANPFNGYSHNSTFITKEMKAYYTPERVLKTLRHCEEEGINAWQSGHENLDFYRQLVDSGSKMQFLAIEGDSGEVIANLAKGGCIGVAHHGEKTDQLFKQGKLDQVHDFLKRVRDAGLMAGVSTHMPDVVDAIESKGWDLDYYMTCVYQRHRTEAELQALMGYVPIPVGEVYLKSDPPRMFKMIQQTKRTCLAFKILAAGRRCDRPGDVEAAFRETFAAIKPTDGVIVGIYDKFSDQVAENAKLVKRFAL